jgi:hypothetical protein
MRRKGPKHPRFMLVSRLLVHQAMQAKPCNSLPSFGFNMIRMLQRWGGKTLKALHLFGTNRLLAWLATGIALILVGGSALAQGGAMSPYQDENDGMSAGGKWMVFRSEDKMTGKKKVRFELLSNNYLPQDPDFKPRVNLFCSDGKYEHADFNLGSRLGRPDYPGFWGQPKMEVRVRIDGYHDNKGWNWLAGRFLSMDKGTIRGAIGAQVFNIEVRTRTGYAIAEFSPAGLDLGEVKRACDLTPHKP